MGKRFSSSAASSGNETEVKLETNAAVEMEITAEYVGFNRQRMPAPKASVAPRCAVDAWTALVSDILERFYLAIKDMEILENVYHVRPKRELEC